MNRPVPVLVGPHLPEPVAAAGETDLTPGGSGARGAGDALYVSPGRGSGIRELSQKRFRLSASAR
jgi:hypothetical protein